MSDDAYKGVIVPLVTPFTRDQKIDQDALIKIVKYVVKNNCAPFIFGTTGESASIDSMDFPAAAKTMVIASGNSKTFAGISSNNMNTSVTLAKQFSDSGVDAVVAHPPYYYPISPERLTYYYQQLADAIPLPLFIYNIPATTHLSIPLDVIDTLSRHPNIVGIKDSERDMQRMTDLIKMCSSRDDFVHLLGWGAELCNALLMGSDGIVPSTGNLTPHLYHMMYQQVSQGNRQLAEKIHLLTDRFSQIYQKGKLLSDSLAAIKVLLNEIGLCGRSVLPPLQETDEKQATDMIKELRMLMKEVNNEFPEEEITWS